MKLGYKEMLRNRITKMQAVDLALKYCCVKTKWIDHVYNHFIGILSSKQERNQATRVILGISSKYRSFDFNKTIAWDNLDQSEIEFWKTIEEWVNWFQDNLLFIQQDINHGATIKEVEQKYCGSLENPNAFAKYLITNLS